MAKKPKLVLHPDVTKAEQRSLKRYDDWVGTTGYLLGFSVLFAAIMLAAWLIRAEHWEVIAYMCGVALLLALCVFMVCIGWPWLTRASMILRGRAFWLPEVFWKHHEEQLARINESPTPDTTRLRDLYGALRRMSELQTTLAKEISRGNGGNKRCTNLRESIDQRWNEFTRGL